MDMTNEELRETAMKELWNAQQNGDTEAAHGYADEALCNLLVGLGYTDVVTEFEKVEKWYA
jgi:hypothetical protein